MGFEEPVPCPIKLHLVGDRVLLMPQHTFLCFRRKICDLRALGFRDDLASPIGGHDLSATLARVVQQPARRCSVGFNLDADR